MAEVFKPIGVFNEPLMDVLVYKTRYELMYSLGRFQEFYENPVMKGKIFTRAELQEWQPNYYVCWQGCNFPPNVVNFFRDNLDAWTLDAHEKEALNLMNKDRFIVGVNLESDMVNTMKHERCHALYYACKEYRNLIQSFYNSYNRCDGNSDLFWDVPLKLEGLGYDKSVLVDEFQAYLMDGTDYCFNSKDELYQELIHWIKKDFSTQLRLN